MRENFQPAGEVNISLVYLLFKSLALRSIVILSLRVLQPVVVAAADDALLGRLVHRSCAR